MEMKKKGFFFVLDAMLALFVLVIGVFLILSSYTSVQQPTQVSLLSDDLLGFLANKRIQDLNNQYAGIGGILWNNGTITDGENTLLQQAGAFYNQNRLDVAEQFIANVSQAVVPSQFQYEFWIDGTRIYPRNPSAQHISSKANTNLLLTSKKVTFGIMNKTTNDVWGPYKAEVFLWQ